MTGRPPAYAGWLWATRGRYWGFRFLLDGDLDDPLSVYEAAFAPLGDERSGWVSGDRQVAVRLLDPDGRRDRSGRLIPHDFVVVGDFATRINSVEDALAILWPQVASTYASVWESERAPSSVDLDFQPPHDREQIE